jgi:copper(I)-binding protein
MPKSALTLFASAAVALMFTVTQAGAHSYQAGALKVDHPWVRPTSPGAPTAAGYLTITNTGKVPDKLLGGASPLANQVEVHQMTMTGTVMRMRPVIGGLDLPAGRTVTLAPGGYHLMLIGPKHAFKLGEHIPATLKFEHAGDVKVDFVVQDAPGAGQSMQGMPGMGGMSH